VGRTASRRRASSVIVGTLLAILFAAGCSSGSSDEVAGPGPSGSTSSRNGDVGFNPPGPPGPTVPDDVGEAVGEWWPLLHKQACRSLVAKTTDALPDSDDPEFDALRAAARTYRAAGEVCLGRLKAARRDAQADVPESGWTDCTGQPALLQRWVRLMVSALGGDSAARRSVRAFPKVSYACVSPSPSETESPSPDESPSESPSSTPSEQ
jgi:hypothetical protein